MKQIRMLGLAEREMIDAALYYNAQAPGLGNDFLNAIEAAVHWVRDFPEAAPVMENQIRRCLVQRFPYALLYRVDSEEIVILAVMHMKRRPGYWTDRNL